MGNPLLVIEKQKSYLQQVLENLDAEVYVDPTEGIPGETDSDSLETIDLNVNNDSSGEKVLFNDAWNYVK